MLARFLERCDRWLEKHFGGHWSAGPLTVYGWNAMHVAVNWRTRRWGYVCFHPPLYWCGQWWPWYFYLSPNATPWASTFLAGPAHGAEEKQDARERRRLFGHNFDTEACRLRDHQRRLADLQ
jgi:hypothetical protein